MRYQAVTEVSPIIVGFFHRQSWQGKQDYPAIGLRSVPAPLQSARSASACAARARRARRHRPCRLVLMDLARAWPGTERVRAALKRLDRLLGSAFLQGACRALYGAMARWLIRQPRPIIIVDRSEVLQPNGRWHLLRAGIPIGGTHGDALRSRTPRAAQELTARRKPTARAIAHAFASGRDPELGLRRGLSRTAVSRGSASRLGLRRARMTSHACAARAAWALGR